MGRVFWTRRGRSDLAEILRYIRQDSRSAGRRFHTQMIQMFQRLADHPKMGERRPEFGMDLRSLPHGNYVVFYRPRKDGISLVRVLHGARDLRKIFRSRR